MKYQSTRSDYTTSDLEAVVKGIAPDGGLFIDPHVKSIRFDWQGCLEKDAYGMAVQILSALLPGYENMEALVNSGYSGKFDTDKLTPLVQVGDDYVLELFHGPTAAFKDVALSMLPQLITAAKKQLGQDETTLILTATSGDTGKAALEGFRDVEGTKIVVFYPDGGVSPIQRAQMATQRGGNVHVCAVRGNFDDCQTGVKNAFARIAEENLTAGKGVELSSANSINIGRLAPQVTYYFIAYAELLRAGKISLGDKVDYVVPTGNFGDILAGYYAKLLGLPVGMLICASNSNKVLTDFFTTGRYDANRDFYRTTSPSMDILVSSNLERMLFLASDGDTELVAGCMRALSEKRCYEFPQELMKKLRESFGAGSCTEAEAGEAIKAVYDAYGYLMDPHTAVAWKAAGEYKAESGTKAPVVVLSTASPFKFPTAVLDAIGEAADGDEFGQMEKLAGVTGLEIPKGLAELRELPVLHEDVIDKEDLIDYVLSKF